MNKNNYYISFTIVLLFFGIFLSTQYNTHVKVANELNTQKTEDLIAMVRDLTKKNQSLNTELERLRDKYRKIETSNLSRRTIVDDLKLNIENLKKINGESDLVGEGIEITISKNSAIIYSDLVKLVNELWAAGAEAVSINDMRITNNSYFYQNETDFEITINFIPLEAPFVVKAIGNPHTLDKGLTLPGGIFDNLALYDIHPEIQAKDEIEILKNSIEQKYWYSAELVEKDTTKKQQ